MDMFTVYSRQILCSSTKQRHFLHNEMKLLTSRMGLDQIDLAKTCLSYKKQTGKDSISKCGLYFIGL